MNPKDFPEDVAMMVGDQVMTKDDYDAAQRQEIEKIHGMFTKMRDQWVQHRATSDVEKRWRRNTQLYFGHRTEGSTGELENTLRNGPPARKATDGNRSRVVINIVRPKVDQAVARMCEILFPVDDRNWGIKPTPMPELATMVGNDAETVNPVTGQPTGLTANEEANAIMQAAKEAAEAMERSIDDSLTECKYNGESRKGIEDGVRLGSMVMYGPFPARQTSKVWLPMPDGTQMLQINNSVVPASMRLDPWDTFFDPSCGNDHQRGRGFFFRRNVTRKELRQLVDLPGFDTEAIREVLRQQPNRVRVAEQRVLRDTVKEDAYEMWTYHGEIEPDEMEMLTSRTGDPLTDVAFGVLVIVNDKIIGAMESWVPDQTLPVDVWCWRKSDESPYGYGLPDELEDQQRVVNSAWRQVMDNGRTSLGGQIVMKKGMVIPQNNSWEITPNKVWLAKDDLADVRQAFSVFEFNSHLEELLAVAQAAMQFADMEASMPQILGGNQGSAPETVGGMVMLYNNANAVLRQRVKLYDDAITRPHIGRYYDWKMANDPDPAIKGDYEVDARGSSALIERDIQNQAMLNLANITNNPRYVPHLREREELKAILKAFKVNPEEIMKPEDQVTQEQQAQQQQGGPADPRIAAAQIKAQVDMAKIEDNKEARQLQAQQIEYNKEREQGEFQIAMTEAAINRDTTLLKLDQAERLALASQQSKERLETLKIDNERQIFNAEAALKVRQGSGI